MLGDTRSDREKAAYQFRIQSERIGYSIEKRVSPYKFQLIDLAEIYRQQLVAVVLPETFDFYTYRLFKHRKYDLLIVQRHNAVVPVNVVDMETGIKYFPGDKVDHIMREQIKRRNADEKRLLLSQIITGAHEGNMALQAMSLRMRQRYKHEADSYLRGRIGRPFAS